MQKLAAFLPSIKNYLSLVKFSHTLFPMPFALLVFFADTVITLVHNQLSLAAGIQLLDASIRLDQYAGETPIPLLLQHGGDDKLTSAQATRDMAERLHGPVTHKEWPGLYHEIHNEPEQEAVFAFTLEWMRRVANLK